MRRRVWTAAVVVVPVAADPTVCYFDEPWLFFTSAPLAAQWGDDWNDAPYEHNAGTPYPDHWVDGPDGRIKVEHTLTRIAVFGSYETPSSYLANSAYSVERINAGAVPWLRSDRFHPGPAGPWRLMAGTPLREALEILHLAGCEVYVRAEVGDREASWTAR